MNLRTLRRGTPAAVVLSLGLALTACGSNDPAVTAAEGGTAAGEELSGAVVIDGSSTVAPLSTVAAEDFMSENPGVNVTVGTSGTGGGFEKFCLGETDISDASRQIKEEEAQACEEAGISFQEFSVANDALTVVVNAENDWVDCLTVEELNAIWAPDSTVSNWSEVREGFPDVPLALFGPGTDSGTFDYFTDEINGEEGASRTDYQASENDNIIVQGVQGDPGAMGYFGFTYYEENADSLKALEIDGGDGCVAPSAEGVQEGTYTPLGRQLFIYPSQQSLQEKPQVEAFVEYYVDNIDTIVEESGYIGLNEEQKGELQTRLEELRGA